MGADDGGRWCCIWPTDWPAATGGQIERVVAVMLWCAVTRKLRRSVYIGDTVDEKVNWSTGKYLASRARNLPFECRSAGAPINVHPDDCLARFSHCDCAIIDNITMFILHYEIQVYIAYQYYSLLYSANVYWGIYRIRFTNSKACNFQD